MLKSIALAYEAKEDRMLTATNAGLSDAWSCWLTRRLVLAVLGELPPVIEKTSMLAQQAPADFKKEMLSFEREAAMASTTNAMGHTPNAVLESSAASAELAHRLMISNHGDMFKLELRGDRGGGAIWVMGRSELQRMIQMLIEEVAKAGWLSGVPVQSPAERTSVPSAAQPARH